MKFAPKKWTARQNQALNILSGDAPNIMLFGGSRSGKTLLLLYCVVYRALLAAGSRHVVLRFRFNHVKASIILDTFPKLMRLCDPSGSVPYIIDKTAWYVTFGNGSQVWFGGLDDKERTEKILGQEYVTVYLNECSQIPWASQQMAVTRLAQLVMNQGDNQVMRPRLYADCNPPPKTHWTHRVFVEGRDPETKKALPKPDDYVCFQMNPQDNAENLPAGYIEQTLMGLSARMRKRFLEGEFADANPNGLFREEDIDKWRVIDGVIPDMVRIVVAVDPSGSGDEDNVENDEIGIVVAGLGVDGNGYLLEDCSVKAGPRTWGNVATTAYDRHEANLVVGEVNYGGAMVQMVVQASRAGTPFKAVTASRGKHVRAEPFSALYEQGRVRHVGHFPKLEDELTAFSTLGYTGSGSPNRADAHIWALAELFAGLVQPKTKNEPSFPTFVPSDPALGMLG